MSLKKLFVNQRFRVHGNTWNALVAGEEKRRAQHDPRAPAARARLKSPVHCRLVWTGAEPLPPGACVKLGDSVADPEQDPAAPFSGLAFECSEFESGDGADTPYAILLGPIDAGDDRPAVGDGILPEAWWVKLDVSDEDHTHAAIPTSGTLLESATSGLRVLWKQPDTGEKWAVVQIAGSGGGKKTALLQATDAIAAAPGGGVPTLSSDFDFVKGDEGFSEIENWSGVEITVNSYLVVLEVGGDMVIVSAFCQEEA